MIEELKTEIPSTDFRWHQALKELLFVNLLAHIYQASVTTHGFGEAEANLLTV